MMLKNSDLLYLMDFDGTIAGSDDWSGYLKNLKSVFKTLHFNPDKLDIRWSILTSRPKIDKMVVATACIYHGVYPREIITSDTWWWSFKSQEEEAQFKVDVMKSILDEKRELSYSATKINSICYVDNNINMIKLINQDRGDYNYIAMSVADFIDNNYIKLI